MSDLNMVIITLAQDRKIVDTQGFISDDQFQKVMIEAKKKGCTVKTMNAGDAKYHRDYNLPVEA